MDPCLASQLTERGGVGLNGWNRKSKNIHENPVKFRRELSRDPSEVLMTCIQLKC